MKRGVSVLVLLLAFVAGFAAFRVWFANSDVVREERQLEAVALVEQFGERLQLVPLMGAPEVAVQAMREHYGPLVDPALLDTWTENPMTAPGRLTSSPYPDRIEVAGVTESDGTYVVEGDIVEETSTGEAGRVRVAITVAPAGGGFNIVAFESGEIEATTN